MLSTGNQIQNKQQCLFGKVIMTGQGQYQATSGLTSMNPG